LNAYLDASVLVSMFTVDGHTPRASEWLRLAHDRLHLSDWTLTEFSSAIAVGVRTARLTIGDRDAAEEALRSWLSTQRAPELVRSDDVRAARALLRATTLPLRAGDALHLAIAQRIGHAIVSFDRRMCEAATDLGIAVEDL
jgi:uncharacterized protein